MTDSASDDPLSEPLEKTDRNRRRREIALLVAQQGRVTVDEIRERFGVSGVTARSDLDALSGTGDLVRSHGGAVSPAFPQNGLTHLLAHASTSPVGFPMPATDEQSRLAHSAVSLIEPLDTVMLCSGGATIEMANLIRTESARPVTVIGYSLQIASCLSDAPHVSLVMLGGLHRYPSGSFVGPHAEQMMRSLHAEHCFLNLPGVTVESGVTTADIMEAHLNQQMIEAASQVTVLAELKSIGHRSLARVTGFDKVTRVICDRRAPAGDIAALRALGVETCLV